MKIEANFEQISTEFQPIPAGEYTFKIEKIEEGETKENKLPMLTVISKIQGGDLNGREVRDFVTLLTKEKKPNEVGLGRIKAYTEAILGKESANGKTIDTSDLLNGTFKGIMKDDSYEKDGKTIPTTKLAKILPAG